jgi:lactoylglutathione lyase
MASVKQLRVVVTTDDYDAALHFYADVLGLEPELAINSPGGRVTILNAGRATLELADPAQADSIDALEVGRRVAGHIRVAFEVEDAPATTRALADAGATVVAEPTRTPWNSLNARLDAPAGLHITLFSSLDPSQPESGPSS